METIESYLLFLILALIAEVIGTISGFGSSILFVPIASLFFDIKIVLGITAGFHVFSNLSKIFLFRKGFNKNIVIKMGIPAIVSVIIGALISNIMPENTLEVLMSLMLIFLSIYLIFTKKIIAQNNKNLIIGGSVSGFLAGLIGTGGAIRGITLAAFSLSKDVFISTSAFIDLGVDFSRAVVYYFNGYMAAQFILLIPFLIAISIIGSWIGKLILQKISENSFKYLVLGIIILSSVVHIIKTINSMV